MTDHGPGTVVDPARPAFARMADELQEQGFDPDQPTGQRTYTATDSPLIVRIDPDSQPPQAHLTHDPTPSWQLTLTGDLPAQLQIMVLFAALHPHHPFDAAEQFQAATNRGVLPSGTAVHVPAAPDGPDHTG